MYRRDVPSRVEEGPDHELFLVGVPRMISPPLERDSLARCACASARIGFEAVPGPSATVHCGDGSALLASTSSLLESLREIRRSLLELATSTSWPHSSSTLLGEWVPASSALRARAQPANRQRRPAGIVAGGADKGSADASLNRSRLSHPIFHSKGDMPV